MSQTLVSLRQIKGSESQFTTLEEEIKHLHDVIAKMQEEIKKLKGEGSPEHEW